MDRAAHVLDEWILCAGDNRRLGRISIRHLAQDHYW